MIWFDFIIITYNKGATKQLKRKKNAFYKG